VHEVGSVDDGGVTAKSAGVWMEFDSEEGADFDSER
jgi:hypothetical protein